MEPSQHVAAHHHAASAHPSTLPPTHHALLRHPSSAHPPSPHTLYIHPRQCPPPSPAMRSSAGPAYQPTNLPACLSTRPPPAPAAARSCYCEPVGLLGLNDRPRHCPAVLNFLFFFSRAHQRANEPALFGPAAPPAVAPAQAWHARTRVELVIVRPTGHDPRSGRLRRTRGELLPFRGCTQAPHQNAAQAVDRCRQQTSSQKWQWQWQW